MPKKPTMRRRPSRPGKKAKKAPVRGRCRVCGCTWTTPCPGGCAWGDTSETICTECV